MILPGRPREFKERSGRRFERSSSAAKHRLAEEKAEQELARTKAELNAKLTEAYVTAEKQHAKQSGKSSSEECETAVAA